MKKLILLLLFIPLVSFGQDNVTVVGVKTETKIVNERELVLSEASTKVRVPLTADLSNYTDILIIKAVFINTNHKYQPPVWTTKVKEVSNKKTFQEIEDVLSISLFQVKNPYKVKSKRANKEPDFLKTIKNPSYLYLYYSESFGRGDDINGIIVLRDVNNKVLYAANHINIGINEVLSPIMF